MKLNTMAAVLALAAAPALAQDGSGPGPFGGRMSTAERAQLAEERFAAADVDGDGQLTLAELVAAAEAAEALRREERVARLIAGLDTNDDGTISLEEAQAAPDSEAGPRGRRHHGGKSHR
jgi:hypothetical protein